MSSAETKNSQLEPEERTVPALSEIFDALPAHVAVIDRSGTIVAVNRAWRAFAERNGFHDDYYGVGENYISVCDATRGVDTYYATSAAEGIRSVLSGELPQFALEYPCRGQAGERWFKLMAAPLAASPGDGAVLMHVDVSERKTAEDLARAGGQRYRLLFERNPHPMWVYDVDTLHFLDVNETAVEIYGYSRDEFLNMTLADIRPESELAALRDSVARVGEGYNAAGVWKHRLKDGRLIDVNVASQALESGRRNTRLVLAVDVSSNIAAEEAMGASERRLRAILDSAPFCICTLSTDGIVIDANPCAVASFGTRRGQLAGEPAERFVATEDRDKFVRMLRQCTMGPDRRLDFRTQTGDGGQRWMAGMIAPVKGPHGSIESILFVARDVSEERRAEAALAALQHRNELVLASAGEGIYGVDADGTTLFVNPPASRLLGWSAADMIGRNLHDLIHHHAADGSPQSWEDCPTRLSIQDGKTRSQEGAFVRADGEYLPVDFVAAPIEEAPGVITGAVVSFRDISTRKAAERELERSRAELAESAERFRIVAQATTDAIWDWNLLTDHVWWSAGMQSLFGYAPDEVAPDSSSWRERIHPDDREAVVESIQERIASGAASWEHRYRFQCKDGSYANVIDRGSVVRDRRGKPIRKIGALSDVTKRLELESQLQRVQRLEALGQLTGGVAHDFNNLLTVILGNAELLAEQLDPASRLAGLARMIESAAQRGADLTQRLLAFARRQTLEPKAVDVNTLVAHMMEMLPRVLGEHVEVSVTRGDDLWAANVDPAQLESALLNLCLNARDAMPAGGSLNIETANRQIDELYAREHVDVAAGDYVLLAVSDSGVGIPAADVNRVFEPFYTTKTRGTGLGLSMVYGFVKQSNGHVSIYSELSHGTTIKLYLPRFGGIATPAERAEVEEAAARGTETILLVEDDEMVREYARSQLLALGYRVIAAASGAEAMQALRLNDDIRLLFTDVVMPGGMNGIELAAAARALRPDLRLLYTSGYSEGAFAKRAIPGSAFGGSPESAVMLLSKPYHRSDLAAKLRQALAGPW